MIAFTLKVEDLTIKQIINICKEQSRKDTCKGCPNKKYCEINFVKEPRFFNDNSSLDGEYEVGVEFYEG